MTSLSAIRRTVSSRCGGNSMAGNGIYTDHVSILKIRPYVLTNGQRSAI
jgi:hypothetical protein